MSDEAKEQSDRWIKLADECIARECRKPDPLAQRLEAIERMGDAVIRWVVTLTFTLCGAAVAAAYVAQYLAGK